MKRGTTPTHTFTLPFATAALSEAYITYAQLGVTKIEKDLSDCTIDGNNLSVTLTQKETLSLKEDRPTEIQVAVKLQGKVMRSQIITVSTDRILKDGEI